MAEIVGGADNRKLELGSIAKKWVGLVAKVGGADDRVSGWMMMIDKKPRRKITGFSLLQSRRVPKRT